MGIFSQGFVCTRLQILLAIRTWYLLRSNQGQPPSLKNNGVMSVFNFWPTGWRSRLRSKSRDSLGLLPCKILRSWLKNWPSYGNFNNLQNVTHRLQWGNIYKLLRFSPLLRTLYPGLLTATFQLEIELSVGNQRLYYTVFILIIYNEVIILSKWHYRFFINPATRTWFYYGIVFTPRLSYEIALPWSKFLMCLLRWLDWVDS